jgi:RNA polymerase sigma-70 factor (ECF subfamily)
MNTTACAGMSPLTANATWALDDDVVPRPECRVPVTADATSETARSDARHAAWMAAAQAGDRHAYEHVLSESVPLIRGVARHQGVAVDALDDVVQETLLTVHRVRHTYDPARSYAAWLSAIARRRAIDALRSHVRRARRETADEHAFERLSDHDDASLDSERAQNARQLRAAIATLPPGQREAVEQLGLKERTLAEAANATGRNAGALKVNLHRALKALRSRLHGDN